MGVTVDVGVDAYLHSATVHGTANMRADLKQDACTPSPFWLVSTHSNSMGIESPTMREATCLMRDDNMHCVL